MLWLIAWVDGDKAKMVIVARSGSSLYNIGDNFSSMRLGKFIIV
jgi:hypothetical protein